MTAEIAIMNKEAVALAADSAVTMTGTTGQKIFTSANKLFALSKYQPVGIMVYGNSILMEVPWETIIKSYRKNLGRTRFDTLDEYASDFLAFLDNGNPLFPGRVQETYLRDCVHSYFRFMVEEISEQVRSLLDEKGTIADAEVRRITSRLIRDHYSRSERTPNIPTVPRNHRTHIIKSYGSVIDEAIGAVFRQLPISPDNFRKLRRIAADLFCKFPEGIEHADTSGIVVAGFGEEESFPSLASFHIDGIVLDRLKFDKHVSERIDFDTIASVIPFAQSEMVSTFMEGANPLYIDVEESYLSQILSQYPAIVAERLAECSEQQIQDITGQLSEIGKRLVEERRRELEKYRQTQHVSPVVGVVSMLPKDELAAMAESLVNLTSFKRRITMELETVGGPIDVAVISKGDGLVWIKRKHYFEAELNPQFFANYYREEMDGKTRGKK